MCHFARWPPERIHQCRHLWAPLWWRESRLQDQMDWMSPRVQMLWGGRRGHGTLGARDAVTGFGAGVRKPPKNEPAMGGTCVVPHASSYVGVERFHNLEMMPTPEAPTRIGQRPRLSASAVRTAAVSAFLP
jgi:hypothetical protein